MNKLNLTKWSKVWLSKPMNIKPVKGTVMIEINGVKGFLVPGDVVFLFNLASELPDNGNYLEVGSWMGLSSIIIANGLIANLNFNTKIFCVDTWEGSIEHESIPEVKKGMLYDTFLRNINEANVNKFITSIKGKSIDVANKWETPLLDMIFIDGDHSAEGCYNDIKAWMPNLRKGGRMLGHDAVPDGGARDALNQIKGETGLNFIIRNFPETHYIWELNFNI